MDDFVKQMLKSAEEKKKKPEPQSNEVDPEEVEQLVKDINEKLKK